MFVSGKCEGMFELLEVIKTTALSAGWTLKKEITTPFDKIYPNESFINSNASLIDGSINSKGNLNFVNLPRKSAINGVEIINLDSGGEVSIYGVLEDNIEILIKRQNNKDYKL
ncbi:MAG: hypothetical protein MR902_02435 [Campylobacter sp.]|nr:hypothetical protein [Campylobacter sp.]